MYDTQIGLHAGRPSTVSMIFVEICIHHRRNVLKSIVWVLFSKFALFSPSISTFSCTIPISSVHLYISGCYLKFITVIYLHISALKHHSDIQSVSTNVDFVSNR